MFYFIERTLYHTIYDSLKSVTITIFSKSSLYRSLVYILYNCFKTTTSVPHSYLLFDLTASTLDALRLDTNIFQDKTMHTYARIKDIRQFMSLVMKISNIKHHPQELQFIFNWKNKTYKYLVQ